MVWSLLPLPKCRFFFLRLPWKMLFSTSSYPCVLVVIEKPVLVIQENKPAWVYIFLHSDFIRSLCCFLVYITFSSLTFLPLFILSNTVLQTFSSQRKQSAQEQAHWTFLPYFKWVIIFQNTHWTFGQKERSQQCAGKLVSLLAAEHSQASRCNICISILPWNTLICPFPRHHLHKEQSTGEPP